MSIASQNVAKHDTPNASITAAATGSHTTAPAPIPHAQAPPQSRPQAEAEGTGTRPHALHSALIHRPKPSHRTTSDIIHVPQLPAAPISASGFQTGVPGHSSTAIHRIGISGGHDRAPLPHNMLGFGRPQSTGQVVTYSIAAPQANQPGAPQSHQGYWLPNGPQLIHPQSAVGIPYNPGPSFQAYPPTPTGPYMIPMYQMVPQVPPPPLQVAQLGIADSVALVMPGGLRLLPEPDRTSMWCVPDMPTRLG